MLSISNQINDTISLHFDTTFEYGTTIENKILIHYDVTTLILV